MRKPFVMRVQADEPGTARAIARALVVPLQERGARVILDGAAQGGGSDCAVHLITAARGMPGASLVIGVWDEHDGARWLAPLDAPAAPEEAARGAMAFLETWGFLGAPRARTRVQR